MTNAKIEVQAVCNQNPKEKPPSATYTWKQAKKGVLVWAETWTEKCLFFFFPGDSINKQYLGIPFP